MPPTDQPKEEIQQLSDDIDALRVLVKALAETADQVRLKVAIEEYKQEHVERLTSMDASDEDVAGFLASFERLQEGY